MYVCRSSSRCMCLPVKIKLCLNRRGILWKWRGEGWAGMFISDSSEVRNGPPSVVTMTVEWAHLLLASEGSEVWESPEEALPPSTLPPKTNDTHPSQKSEADERAEIRELLLLHYKQFLPSTLYLSKSKLFISLPKNSGLYSAAYLYVHISYVYVELEREWKWTQRLQFGNFTFHLCKTD